MKILVIGGMHGNEPLGQQVVKLFREKPIKDVATSLANEEAIKANVRFIGSDLNRSFPGDETSNIYEVKRAAEIVEMTKGYDIVIDFHNTNCPDNDCVFVGQDAETILLDSSFWFGLRRVIVADYDCLNKYAPNCMSIEVSLASKLNDAKYWYNKISELSSLTQIEEAESLELYRFVYRMSLADRDTLQLPAKQLKAFKAIEPRLANAMGVKSPAYPIFVNDAYTPYNYGGLLNKIDV